MNRRITFIHLGIILGLGLAIGLLGWLLFPKVPVISDFIEYFTLARNLLVGRGLVSSYPGATDVFIMGLPCPDTHMPGWPLLIAGFMWLTRLGPCSSIVLCILLTIITSVLVYFIVLFWSDDKKALVASLVFLLFPWTIAYEFTGMAESAFVFWVALSVFFASIPNQKCWLVNILGAGLSLLLAYITRESALFFLPLIVALLRMRGLSFWKLILFSLSLLIASFLSSYIYYSSYPGFREVRETLALYDLLTKTWLPKIKYPITSIVTREDLPQLPLKDILWNVIVIKPIRIIVSVLKGEGWYPIIIRSFLVLPVIVAPLVVKGRLQKTGLIFNALILIGVATLYRGYEFTTFMRITMASATVALIFIMIWLKGSFSKWPYYALLILFEMGIGSKMYVDFWKDLSQSERIGKQLAEALQKYLGPDPAVMGWGVHPDYPLHLLDRPDDYVILYFDDPTDPNFITLRDRTNMRAFISHSQCPDFISWGWHEDTLAIENEVMYLYRRLQ